MRLKQLTLTMMLILSLSGLSAQTKTDEPKDKYTIINIQIETVTDTGMGKIVEYVYKDEIRTIYLPNEFLDLGIVVIVYEDNDQISPQGSLVLKNGKQFKFKLYQARRGPGYIYKLRDYLPKEEKEKFKVSELSFEF